MTARCDIVIAVWNALAFTKDCIDSIERNTSDVDYRLIIVDNASDRETAEYLRGFANSKKESVRLIRNDTNLGFLKAANQGLRVSGAPYICLLNNDTIVTDGWLKEMIDVARGHEEIGLVNPSSNNLGQKPSRGEPIEHFAGKFSADKGKFVELGAAIGFCMLIRREVMEKIGVFDEAYGMGNFEDTDYSRRAVQAGWRCVRACGAYVYHRESSSFNKVRTFNEDFERNREIFEFRWGVPRRIAYVLDSYEAPLLKKLESESVDLARAGNRIWYFFKTNPGIPEHGNIIPVHASNEHFYLDTTFRILKKKKRFDEIYVGGPKYGRVLEALAFIHRAKVKYY